MKKLFCIMALAGAFFTACNEKVDPVGDGNKDPNPAPTEQAPAVSLTAGEATTESLAFVIAPENAVSVRYAVYESDAALPTAEELLTPASGKAGTPADAINADTYVVKGLKYATDYTVVAAAQNSVGYSDLMTVSMKTATPVATVSLALVQAEAEKVVCAYLENVEAALLCSVAKGNIVNRPSVSPVSKMCSDFHHCFGFLSCI